MDICIVPFRAFLKVINLSGSTSHCKDLFDASLRICARQIALSKQETHHVLEFGLWIQDEILEANKEHGNLTEFGVIHHMRHPTIDVYNAVSNPSVKEVGVYRLIIKGALDRMVVHCH